MLSGQISLSYSTKTAQAVYSLWHLPSKTDKHILQSQLITNSFQIRLPLITATASSKMTRENYGCQEILKYLITPGVSIHLVTIEHAGESVHF